MACVDGNGGSRLMVTELSHIKELVKQLDEHLGDSPDLCKFLAAQIFSVTEKSIGMIRSAGNLLNGRKRTAGGAGLDSPPLSATPSPLSHVSDAPFKTNKKRKVMEKRKHQIRVSPEGGAETPIGDGSPLGDGHSWRKYGQKEILGAKHPRGYYRCTHRTSQGCAATKQVQRTDEDPTLFDVIYHGTHTCVHKPAAAIQAAAAGQKNPNARSVLMSLSESLTVQTEGLTAAEPQAQRWDAMPFCFSSPVSGLAPPEHSPFSTPSTPENCCFGLGVSLPPSLELSPATSASNHHLSMAPFQAEWSAQSEFQEVVSAMMAAGCTPASAMETNFSIDIDGFDQFDPSFDVFSFFS